MNVHDFKLPVVAQARLLRHLLAALAISSLLSSLACGQEWARKMFSDATHDFGTVARGAKVEHRFKFKNIYVEDLHVVGVRTSCGCTTPTITKHDLKTWETGEVVATFNTRTFLGYRSATLTVTIDRPFYAEVQLQVSGNIRGDIVVNPGAIDLGSVDYGRPVERKISVVHAGRSDWRIVDVRSANSNFEVEVFETRRNSAEAAYDLLVRLKDTAPVGYIKEQLMLVTNDSQAQQFPIDVEGRVVAALTVSPSSLSLGALSPGQKVSKNLVVRGKQPFKILEIQCTNPDFSFVKPQSAREIHLVPVTFTAGSTPGKISEKIRIQTDLGTGSAAELIVQAQVLPAAEQAAAGVADQR